MNYPPGLRIKALELSINIILSFLIIHMINYSKKNLSLTLKIGCAMVDLLGTGVVTNREGLISIQLN